MVKTVGGLIDVGGCPNGWMDGWIGKRLYVLIDGYVSE